MTATAIIIMGPSGCGKSSISKALSTRLDCPMVEGDDCHPPENIDKQQRSIPLTDEDRAAWLDALVVAVSAHSTENVVLACSALTPYVQNRLKDELERECVWILLDVPREVLARRLAARENHFMSPHLLDNQLSTLQPPENTIRIPSDRSIDQICADIETRL